MLRTFLPTVVLSALALSACTTGEQTVVVGGDGPDPIVEFERADDPAPGRLPVQLATVDLVHVDGDTWSLDVGPVVRSVLVVARGADADDEVEVLDVLDPNGTSLADWVVSPVNNGENAVLLPRFVDEALMPGTYTFRFDSARGVQSVRAVTKSGDVDQHQQVDVSFWVVTDHPDVAAGARRELADLLRQAGDEALGPVGLGVGGLEFVQAPDDAVARFAELELPTTGNDAAQRELCRAMDDAVGQPQRVHVAIVDRVVDEDDPEGETEGNAAGIPGAAGLPGTWTSCVVVIADGSRPLAEMADVVWHEVGHLLGLPHSTEATGDAFDFFLDTPECDVDQFDLDGDEYLDADECADADAGNLMFHDNAGRLLSPEQGWLLRHHPLFHPA